MEEAVSDRWCARCKEDDASFEVAEEPSGWAMGVLRLLSKAPKWMRERLRGAAGHYLCGNCYFDLMDEAESS